VFIEARDDGGGADNWSYKSCKAPVKSSPPTNQHPVFLQAGCPSCCPTNNVKAQKGSKVYVVHFVKWPHNSITPHADCTVLNFFFFHVAEAEAIYIGSLER